MSSLTDKYCARPISNEFDSMCLAAFCSEYRVLASSQVSKNPRSPIHSLQKNLGYIQKRTLTEKAVIRYPRFSPDKAPEKYYFNILQLFCPHRSIEEFKSKNTYEEFYNSPGVKKTVEINQSSFEKDIDVLEKAEETLENGVFQENAWSQICPETEVERLECISEKKLKKLTRINWNCKFLIC